MLSIVKNWSFIYYYVHIKKRKKERKKNQLLPKTIHSFLRGQYNQGIIKETNGQLLQEKKDSPVF